MWLINIHAVAKQTGNNVKRSTLLNFVADLLNVQQSRPCWIQLCCQCVPGLSFTDDLHRLVMHQFDATVNMQQQTKVHCTAHKDPNLLQVWCCSACQLRLSSSTYSWKVFGEYVLNIDSKIMSNCCCYNNLNSSLTFLFYYYTSKMFQYPGTRLYTSSECNVHVRLLFNWHMIHSGHWLVVASGDFL